jgi:hypothetical protein
MIINPLNSAQIGIVYNVPEPNLCGWAEILGLANANGRLE